MTSKKKSQDIIYVETSSEPHEGTLYFQGQQYPCALGRAGIVDAKNKVEGDGATPRGQWPLRKVFFRSDRLPSPKTVLPTDALQEADGWCDALQDPAYNQHIHHPYPASAEKLWRADHLYDLIIPLGYNDRPVVMGKGSAIFFHILKRDTKTNNIRPTEGCVALDLANMLEVLKKCSTETTMAIR